MSAMLESSAVVSSSIVQGRWFSTPRILYMALDVSVWLRNSSLGLPIKLFAAMSASVLPVVVSGE